MLTNSGKWIALLAISVSAFTAGCAGKTANQVRQQAAPAQPAQPVPYTASDSRIDIAKGASEKVTQVSGVKQANVLVTRRNAYVAAVVDTAQNRSSAELENEIASQVRAADPSVQRVYVSTNPEFVNRVNQYVLDVQQGRPVSGFVQEFSQMVQRVFPSAR